MEIVTGLSKMHLHSRILFARFLAAAILAGCLFPPLLPALDLDQNGVSDVYESFYPPQADQTLLPLSSDADGDGFTNLQETAFGTDWRANSSRVKTELTGSGSNLFLSWFGVKRIGYQAQTAGNLTMPTNWLPVGSVQIGANQTISLPVSSVGQSRSFWRLLAKDPLDEDGDGLNAYEEGMLGTSDTSKDSDGDGNSDAQEFQQGTNPADAGSNYLPILAKLSGDNQTGPASSISNLALTVGASSHQAWLVHVPITFTISAGGGSLIPDRNNPSPVQSVTLYTDQQGQVGSFFQFGPSTSQITATVRAGAQTSSVTFTTSPVIPNNDFFAQSRSLDIELSPLQQATSGATLEASEPVHADTLEGASLWYTWTAPASGRMAFRADGSDFDTILAVYTGSAIGSLTEIASNDDQTDIEPLPFASRVVFEAVQGTIYHIAAAGFAGATGLLNLAWGTDSGPANDFFANAQALTGNSGNLSASNVGATVETLEPRHHGEVHSGSLWYSLQTPQAGKLNISTDGTPFATVLGVYTGSMGNFTQVASTDSGQLDFSVTQNSTYWIAAAGLGLSTGNISLSWNYQGSNDNFSDAASITGDSGTIPGSNVGATTEVGEPDHYWYGCSASIWYTWTAPASGDYVFDTSGSDFDNVIAVYTGSAVASLSCLGVDSESGGPLISCVQFTAVEGTVYHIAVDGLYYGCSGNTVLNWAPLSSMSASPQASKPQLSAQELRDQQTTENAKRDGEFQTFAAGLVSSASEETCPDPAAANYGEVIHIDNNGIESGTRTVYLSLPKPVVPNAPPMSCPQSVSIQHKIVTVNTPRSRNLPGKLNIRLKSGNGSIVDITQNGASYALGSPIDVVEYGHSGCGIHDWHLGYTNFEFTGLAKGEVVFEIECDPDPDDGGDGVATKKLELTIKVFELTFVTDPVTDLGVSASSPWNGKDGYTLDPQSIKQKIAIVTDPADVGSLITLDVKELDQFVNSDYNPSGIGSIVQTEPSVFEYSAFTEPKTEKAPKEKSAIIVAKINDTELCAKHKIRVLPIFRRMTGMHQHGPGVKHHAPQASDYETAWRYAGWKYDISLSNLSSIVYKSQGTASADAFTSFVSGSRGARPCEIYPSAFATENYCASVLGHENVHGGQSVNFLMLSWPYKLSGAFNRKIEYHAYSWMVNNATRCGLSAGESGQVTANMNRTKQGQDPL